MRSRPTRFPLPYPAAHSERARSGVGEWAQGSVECNPSAVTALVAEASARPMVAVVRDRPSSSARRQGCVGVRFRRTRLPAAKPRSECSPAPLQPLWQWVGQPVCLDIQSFDACSAKNFREMSVQKRNSDNSQRGWRWRVFRSISSGATARRTRLPASPPSHCRPSRPAVYAAPRLCSQSEIAFFRNGSRLQRAGADVRATEALLMC